MSGPTVSAARGLAVRRSGDGAAFAEDLYARHGAAVLRLTRRLAGPDHQLAEDLAQEALTRAWLNRDGIALGAERSWLAATSRNLAVDAYRRRRSLAASAARHAALPAPGGDDVAGRVAVTVGAAVAALPAGRRAVIEELYFAGRTTREAAAVLGIAQGTVKSRAHCALSELRAALGGSRP